MPSKSQGLFPASLSTDPLLCLAIEFVEITNKIETAGDLKARERKGVAVGKDKYILFCARFAATVALRARSQVTFVDDCLVAVAVAEARAPPDEYEPDSGDDFSDREDEDIAPVTISRSGRPIRAHLRLDL